MKLWLGCILCLACASAPTRDPSACPSPAERVEVEQIQVGWNRFDTGNNPPVVDVDRPSRDERQAATLANELMAKCAQGAKLEALQDKYSEAQGGSVVLGRNSDVPYKAAALCLQPNECVVVRSKIAFHVLKRIR